MFAFYRLAVFGPDQPTRLALGLMDRYDPFHARF
jgi:hypothetical protein